MVPSSGGVPPSGGQDVVMAPWNDLDADGAPTLERHAGEIAAIICEPIWYNAGCMPPVAGFLQALRERATEDRAVLIFDEVLSGFRTALGGAQEFYGVTPDLTTLAKALANGMPCSVVGGRADLMAHLAPRPIARSSTCSGHLLCVLAALATLDVLGEPGLYDRLNAQGESFYRDLQGVL